MTDRRRMLSGENLTSKGVVNGVIQDDWDQIVKICQSGRAADFYSIGDYKNVDLGSEGTIPYAILGFNQEIRSDGKGFAGTTWRPKKALNTSVAWDSNRGTDWTSSSLRNYLNSTLKNKFPAIISQNIISVFKFTEVVANITMAVSYVNIKRSIEDVWILSSGEMQCGSEFGGYTDLSNWSNYSEFNNSWARSVSAYDSTKIIPVNFYIGPGGPVASDRNSSNPTMTARTILPCFCL